MVSVISQTKRLFIILSLIFVSSAATLSVNGTGANCLVGTQTNYSTIQTAVTAASAGDTIYVCRNSTTGYRENVGINKSVNLYGNESGVMVVASSTSVPVFSVNATYVNITNFTLTGATGSSSAGIEINSSANYTYVYNVTANGSVYGFYLKTSNYNNLTNNTAYSNTRGFWISGSHNNILTNNIAYNNTQFGFWLSLGSSNNTISNSLSFNNSAVGFRVSSNTNNNTLNNNSAYNNTQHGFYVSSTAQNHTLINNSAYNNTQHGFYLLTSANFNNLTNNSAYNNIIHGFFISDSSNNTISSNLAYNNSNGVGILLHNMSNANNVSYNTVYRNLDGISLNINVSGSNISSNLAYNNTQYGLVLSQEAQNNSAYNNTVYNNTQHGVFLHTASHNNSFISNTVYDNPNNFVFSAVDNSTLTSNYAYNSSGYGFYFAISTGNNLSSNNATNNSIQYGIIDYSNITFTGINRALQTPSTGLDLNITNYSNVTTLVGSTYSNFTTSYGTIFFDNAINVTVKLMNLSDSGASSTGCGSVFTGTCTLLTLSNNIVNISNASATGTIILGMFYNTSTSPTSSNVYIGKYVTANSGWNQVGQTAVDTANGTVRYGAITSFSTFGIVNFVAAPPPPPSDDTVVKSLEIDYDFTCSDGSLEVSTTSGAEVSLVELSPAYIQLEKKEADSDGKALFTITEDGTYKIRATKSGYRSEDKDNLEFSLCEEGTPEDEEEPEPEPQPDQPGEQLECNVDSDCEEGYECTDNNCVLKPTPEPPTPDDSQAEALEGLNRAQQQLDQAKKEGKDVAEAQKKLDEAKEAYENGEYERAKQLLSGVQSLVKESEEKPPEIKKPVEPKEPEEEKSDLFGLLLIAGSAVVVVVVLVGAYLFLKGGKLGGYKFKK